MTGLGRTPNPADPYMTAVCYFNALRELGGARRIVEDEVRDRADRYGTQRRRVLPKDKPFADRRLKEPLELTSRVSTDEVAKAKQRLEAPFGASSETVDVALATNMISVGLDITRLGLMLVQGQPKTAAEYIQATSRVGRDHNRPGLVVAVLNLHKPRDRMHFEQFGQFHRTFYRAVEATSVTPWAARALDRALAAIVVAAARHINPSLTPENAVTRLRDNAATRAQVRDAILLRAPPDLVAGGTAALAAQINDVLDAWTATAAARRLAAANSSTPRQPRPPDCFINHWNLVYLTCLPNTACLLPVGRCATWNLAFVCLSKTPTADRSRMRTIWHDPKHSAAKPDRFHVWARLHGRPADAIGGCWRSQSMGDAVGYSHFRAAPHGKT